MKTALVSPSQLSRLRVRGIERKNVTTEKIARRINAHNPLSERVESACWPDKSTEP